MSINPNLDLSTPGKVLHFPTSKTTPRRVGSGLRQHWHIGAALALIAVLGGTAFYLLLDANDPAPYVATAVTRGAITPTATATATVSPGAHGQRRHVLARRHPEHRLRLHHASRGGLGRHQD